MDVVFLADFHTFAQSQRNGLRLVRELLHHHAQKKDHWMIGLELIPSRYQKVIDRFLTGKLSLTSLYREIHYEEEWGFPWANYVPLFEWAKYHGVPIIALNRPKEITRNLKTDAQELESRDDWAAGIITDRVGLEGGKMFVLYGELHVSQNHLPAKLARVSKAFLKKPLRSISIHQDLDWIYFKLSERGRELSTQVVKLSARSYALVSSPPWMKLQSLLSWAEDRTSENEDGEIDWLSKFKFHLETLCFFLDLKPPNSGSLTLKTIADPPTLDRKSQRAFSRTDLSLIKKHRRANEKIYLPGSQVAYAGSPSENRLAELASDHLFVAYSKITWIYQVRDDDFFRLVMQAAFGFFGSLAFNPRRKCDLLQDQKKRIEFLRKNPGYRVFAEESGARSKAVRFLETGSLRAGKTKLSSFADMMAAKYIGQIFGLQVYRAVMAGKLSREEIKFLFLGRPGDSETFYQNKFNLLISRLQKSGIARPRPSQSKHAGF